MCMVVMTADVLDIVFKEQSNVTIIELSAGVLYIGVRVTACIESRNRKVECQNQIPSLSFCARRDGCMWAEYQQALVSV